MDLGQVDVLHVICAVVVANLSSCPVHALYLDDLSIVDLGGEGNCERRQWQS